MDDDDLRELPIPKEVHRQKILYLVHQLINPQDTSSQNSDGRSSTSATSTVAPSSPRGISVTIPRELSAREVAVKCIFKDKVFFFFSFPCSFSLSFFFLLFLFCFFSFFFLLFAFCFLLFASFFFSKAILFFFF